MSILSNLNRDSKTRDQIIFGQDVTNTSYNIKNFENLSLSKLKELFNKNFIADGDYQNDSPTAKEFLDFLKENPKFTVNGYVVSIKRDDYRTTITGVNHDKTPLSNEELINFSNMFHDADEFDIQKGYAWYD
jgi:hypothetical protein